MLLHAPVVRSRVGDHERGPDHRRFEPELPGDAIPEAPLAIERPNRLADIDDLRLDLDEQERPGRRVPGDDVHEATLTVDAEGHLRTDLPALRPEPRDQRFGERGVIRSGQALHIPRTRPQPKVYSSLEDAGEAPQVGEADRFEVAPLDARDGLIRDAGERGDVALSHTPSQTQDTNESAEANVVHVQQDRGLRLRGGYWNARSIAWRLVDNRAGGVDNRRDVVDEAAARVDEAVVSVG